jgi:hypothetical protein
MVTLSLSSLDSARDDPEPVEGSKGHFYSALVGPHPHSLSLGALIPTTFRYPRI